MEETTTIEGHPIPAKGATYWTLSIASIPYKRTVRFDEVDIFNFSYGFYWKTKKEAVANIDWHAGFIERLQAKLTELSYEGPKENLT